MSDDTISVNEAIKKGRWLLVFFPAIIITGFPAIVITGMYFFNNGPAGKIIWILTSFMLGFLIAFIYYFTMLPRWRIWAFSRVKNVHELIQTAFIAQLVWKEGNKMWKWEIKTANQKRLIEELEQRFKQPDIFEDDPQVPYETAFSYPAIEKYFFLILALATGAGFINYLLQHETKTSLYMLIGSLLSGFTSFKRFQTKRPLLLISNEGIRSENYGFHPWSLISNEHIKSNNNGIGHFSELCYTHNNKILSIHLNEMTGQDAWKLVHLLRVYRVRYNSGKADRMGNNRD